FSSRRRHTRSKRDWSSDVCSSDLFLILSSEINHWNIIFRLLITFFILISIQLPLNLSSHDRLKLRASGLTDLFISLSSLIQIGVSDRSSSTLLKKSFNLCLLYTSVSRTSVWSPTIFGYDIRCAKLFFFSGTRRISPELFVSL